MSTPALELRVAGRVRPLVENPAIQMLRLTPDCVESSPLLAKVIPEADLESWTVERLRQRPRPAEAGAGFSASILLVEEGYQGFNLVLYDRMIYGLSQADGPFDIERVHACGYRVLFSGTTVQDVKRQIDVQAARPKLKILVTRRRRLMRGVRPLMGRIRRLLSPDPS